MLIISVVVVVVITCVAVSLLVVCIITFLFDVSVGGYTGCIFTPPCACCLDMDFSILVVRGGFPGLFCPGSASCLFTTVVDILADGFLFGRFFFGAVVA